MGNDQNKDVKFFVLPNKTMPKIMPQKNLYISNVQEYDQSQRLTKHT